MCAGNLREPSEKFFDCRLKLLNQVDGNADRILGAIKTAPKFDRAAGFYACEVEMITSINDLIRTVKDDELHFELVASLPNGISSVFGLKMVPAVNVFPQEISIEQADQQTITVTGLERVLQQIQVI